MDYNPLSQVDDDAASQPSDSEVADHAAIAGESAHESILSVPRGLGHLIDGINNNKSPAYDMVEDDDYEETIDQNKTKLTVNPHVSSVSVQQTSTVARSSATGAETVSTSEALVRTSSDVSIPLRHPTPDLQSLQGAYVGNIERLEKSAERLSVSSSDIGVELRKLDLEQKRRSSASSAYHGPDSPTYQMSPSSLSNSIIAVNSAARTGGYSPGGYLSSPRGSIISGSRFRSTSVTSPLQEIQEPGHEEEMEANTFDDKDVPILTPRPLPFHHNTSPAVPNAQAALDIIAQEVPDRPLTARSTDTYQQATNLFLDFDGVHFTPHPREAGQSRQMPVNKVAPLPATAEPRKEHVDPNMVYYPAPIPKFLNLPQRLSKQSAKPNHEKRRTQLLDTIDASDRTNEMIDEIVEQQRVSKRLSTLPPQLRASVFFEKPLSNPSPLGVQLKDRSAVSTLDSILDASTHAPVSAFTDHPIVGSAGGKVYGPTDKKRASRLPPGKNNQGVSKTADGPRASALFVPGQGLQTYSDTEDAEKGLAQHSEAESGDQPSHSGSSSDDEESDSNDSEDEEAAEDDEVSEHEEMENDEHMIFGRPATLLAELEMRKQEQKQRNRTAAKAFPNGMHSTLLELDAVAQAQSNKRRQKHVTLAWEAEAAQDPDDTDDEDIPLGVLYGSKNPAVEERPLGLMERREMEENEPLSRRRARLRGEVVSTIMPNKRASTMTQLRSFNPVKSDSDDDEETLAQRLQRLKKEKQEKSKSVVSTEFENEIMAALGELHPEEAAAKKSEPTGSSKKAVDEEEETLGQRKKRLQAEAQAQAQKGQEKRNVRSSRSMADILQAYPSSRPGVSSMGNPHSRPMTLNPAPTHAQHAQRFSTGFTMPPSMAAHPGLQPGLQQTYGYPGGMYGYETQPAYGNRPYNAAFMTGAPMAYNAGMQMQYPHNAAMMQQNVDARQRDIIDRWRQSIVK